MTLPLSPAAPPPPSAAASRRQLDDEGAYLALAGACRAAGGVADQDDAVVAADRHDGDRVVVGAAELVCEEGGAVGGELGCEDVEAARVG